MSKLQDLKNRGYIGLDVAPIRNSLIDSVTGVSATAAGSCSYKNIKNGRAVSFGSNGYLSIADATANRLDGDGWLVVLGDLSKHSGLAQRYISKRDAGGVNYELYQPTTTEIRVYDGTTESIFTLSTPLKASFLAVRFGGAGQKPELYVDGAFHSLGNVALTIASDDAPVYLGNYYAATLGNPNPLNRFIVINDGINVTPEDISELCEELSQERGATIGSTKGVIWNNPLIYPDFEKDANWTKGTGWTISGGFARSDGSQADVSDLSQAILIIGKEYTIKYKITRSAGTIKAMAGTTEGTAQSADGEYVERLTCAGNTNFILRADADFVGTVDWVKINDGVKLVYDSNLESIPPTLANVTAGRIGYTDFEVASGTWAVTEDTDGKKWIENVVAGVAYKPSKQAYGTWVFEMNKTETSIPYFLFVLDRIDGGSGKAGSNGYDLGISSGEQIAVAVLGGGITNKMITAVGTVTAGIDYRFAVSRSLTGVFSTYIKGGSFTTWTLLVAEAGANPFTDTTVTSSKYACIDLDAGDKFRFIKHYEGVIDPTKTILI